MTYGLYMTLFGAVQLAFVFAFGACVGSLLNVLVYRLPLGLDVVRPTSRCPLCGTKLTWRENVPIVGWLALGGRCRFCRGPISAEYPVVEALVGLIFAGFYAWYFLAPDQGSVLGVEWGARRPEWTENGVGRVWPTYLVLMTLLSCLVAATLIDARTFTIPASIVNVPTAAGLIGHTAHAAWIGAAGGLAVTAEGWDWTIPTPERWGWIPLGAALGGIAGIALSMLLVWSGLLKRSFEDYAAWEAEAIRRAEADAAAGGGGSEAPAGEAAAALWVQYPYARREMVRELAFVAAPIALAIVGAAVGRWFGAPWSVDPMTGALVSGEVMPLWAQALAGSLLGYLIGGGVVWLMRIAGSLAFGKEALGLGDVHLMAAVGACLGWISPVVAFFVAAFVGVAVEAVRGLTAGEVKRTMPYGPYLAIATLLVVLFQAEVELGLGVIFRLEHPLSLP